MGSLIIPVISQKSLHEDKSPPCWPVVPYPPPQGPGVSWALESDIAAYPKTTRTPSWADSQIKASRPRHCSRDATSRSGCKPSSEGCVTDTEEVGGWRWAGGQGGKLLRYSLFSQDHPPTGWRSTVVHCWQCRWCPPVEWEVVVGQMPPCYPSVCTWLWVSFSISSF